MRLAATVLFLGILPVLHAQTPQVKPSEAEKSKEVVAAVEQLKRLKFSGYIQAQYLDDSTAAGEGSHGQFTIRRGRLKAVYAAAETARLTLQIDASSAGVELRDAYIELMEPWTSWRHTLTAGQFKWPFGFEVLQSSSDREMPERSRVVRALFPGERDRGVMLSGTGWSERFRYHLALVNGSGISRRFDPDENKDLVGRLTWDAGPLDLGVSAYLGEDGSFDKQRQGIDVQLATPLPGLTLRGEYIGGEERGQDVDGWYAYVIKRLAERHQLVLRVDEYDPGANLDVFTVGGSYLYQWDRNTRLMFAFESADSEQLDNAETVTVRVQYRF